jgi:ubiquinol-cytochrome c reductase cytochrome c1 subunit
MIARLIKSSLLLVCLPLAVLANDGHAPKLDKVHTDVLDTTSLQRGANIYAQYCMGCHSLKYLRVSRAARDLHWTPEEGVSHFQYLRGGKGKPQEAILTTLNPVTAKAAFGVLPPDLSLEARLRGKDWVYTFLRSYERDSDGKVSNHLFNGVAMPYILEGMQQQLPAAEFDAAVADLVNFMDYAAEPAKPIRLMLGWWVLGFLALLFTLTYLLKKEFWRDIKHQA